MEPHKDSGEERLKNYYKNKVGGLKNFYYKGFGNIISAICMYINFLQSHPFDEELYDGLRKLSKDFEGVEDYYYKIPFNRLKDNPDFKPLFKEKDLIPYFGKAVRKYIEELRKERIRNGQNIQREKAIKEYMGEIRKERIRNRQNTQSEKAVKEYIEEPGKDPVNDIKTLGEEMCNIGEEYRDTFFGYIEKVRELDKNFKVEITDYRGLVFPLK